MVATCTKVDFFLSEGFKEFHQLVKIGIFGSQSFAKVHNSLSLWESMAIRDSELMCVSVNEKLTDSSYRTLYVLIAVAICAVMTGLLVFFLYPRSVDINNNLPLISPTFTYVNDTARIVFLTVVNKFNVTNTNFFSVQVTQMNITCYFDQPQRVIGQQQNNTHLTIPLRSQRTYEVALNLTFSGDEGYIA
ncbi:hypothetical protein CAPTEDRAFT_185661 [Capitella teleta]|uniref:Transmembrane protein 106 C-terminal domain-containing protein n=1 Tax=Capitella teleta TaxID=283909 RepID=R7TCG0_CAPTE|nr:hypothetical protein CAPTEDRAFT_185661 [Capitella teleta]|eukprot:ELT89182.1 hypothetical protein CAPTEDRAFT_185661 [Capitella teleta]